MLKRLLVTAFTAMLAVGIGYADQSNAKVTIPVNKTSATSGKQMYANYCAPCHGVDGRGQGPVASALKTPPTDLTVLSRNNRGKFPDSHIATVLQNGTQISSHGTAEMPVWGPILGKMDQTNSQDRLLRISNLSRYLETLQVK
ncbi:MAG TPA: c-type cytochrome [Terracidiphilus sp.]|jgi:mono/diheme cytochrome c family protein